MVYKVAWKSCILDLVIKGWVKKSVEASVVQVALMIFLTPVSTIQLFKRPPPASREVVSEIQGWSASGAVCLLQYQHSSPGVTSSGVFCLKLPICPQLLDPDQIEVSHYHLLPASWPWLVRFPSSLVFGLSGLGSLTRPWFFLVKTGERQPLASGHKEDDDEVDDVEESFI